MPAPGGAGGRRCGGRRGQRAVSGRDADGGPGGSGDRRRAASRTFPGSVEPAPFGAASGYVQFVSPERHGPGARRAGLLLAADRADGVRPRDRGERQRAARSATARVNGTKLRVLTHGHRRRGAVLIARPLTEVDTRAQPAAADPRADRRRRHRARGAARRGRRAHRAGADRALHPAHRDADGQPRPLAAARGRGPRRARAAGGELQRDARRARALGRGAAPSDRRRQPRAAHADLLAAREHPGARRGRAAARRRSRRACARTSSRSSTS